MPKKVIFKGVKIRNTKIIGSGGAVDTSSISGIVADGYIKSAQVNIINAATGEVVGTTYTDSSGAYSIDIPNLPPFIIIEALGGVDISTNKPYTGKLKSLKAKENISQPVPITPITTIVTEAVTSNNAQVTENNINAAMTAVADGLGISVSDVDTDFIAANNTQVAKKAAQVATVIKTITETVGDDQLAANEVALTAITEKITGQISFGLENVDNIKAVVTLAANKTGDSDIIQETAAQVDDIASSTSIVTQAINNISEVENPTISLEIIAKINAATDELLLQPTSDFSSLTVETLNTAIQQVEVYDVYQPIKTDPPSPIYAPWTTTKYPPLEGVEICAGDSYITVNILDDWSVYVGAFDPFSLADGVLKRLKDTECGTAQTGLALAPDTTYVVSMSGAGRYILESASGVVWSTGSTNNYIDLDNETVTVTMSAVTDSIRVDLMTNTQEVSGVSMKDTSDIEILQNTNFTERKEMFYAVEGWHGDQDDPVAVSPWSLGYILGFNEYMKFTLFADPVIIPDTLIPATNLTYNINNTVYDANSILQPPTDLTTTITYDTNTGGHSLPTSLQVQVNAWDPSYGGTYTLVDPTGNIDDTYYTMTNGGIMYMIDWPSTAWRITDTQANQQFFGGSDRNDPTGAYGGNKFSVSI